MNEQPTTITELRAAIEAVINRQAIEAAQMPYDRKVWINAVDAARRTFQGVAVDTSIEAYHKAIVEALDAACIAYSDPDGEHTNGTGAISNVLFQVSGLLPATQ